MAFAVFARFPDGETVHLEMDVDATVGDLRKFALAARPGVMRPPVRVSLGGAVLPSGSSLADAGVSQEAVVELVPGARGPPSALHHAVRMNNTTGARQYLEREGDPDALDPTGRCALHGLHTMAGDMVRLLAQHGACLDVQDETGVTPLMVCVDPRLGHRGDRVRSDESALALLECGADPTIALPDGRTPLHALMHDARQPLGLVDALLGRGAVIDAEASGWTPLAKAIDFGNTDMAVHLLRSGAKWELARVNGCRTPLSRVAREHTDGEVLIRELVSRGAPVDAGVPGSPRVTSASTWTTDGEAMSFTEECNTPLMAAVRAQHAGNAIELLCLGADPNAPASDSQLLRPLHAAITTTIIGISSRWHVLVRDLIKRGADVNAVTTRFRDPGEWTPLLLACRHTPMDIPECIPALIDAGADPNPASPEGWRPLHYVAEKQDSWAAELTERLIAAGAEVDTRVECPPPSDSARHRSCTSESDGGEEAAAEEGGGDTAAGSDGDIEPHKWLGMTPLYIACSVGVPGVARALIRSGADTKITDKDGNSILHCLAQQAAVPADLIQVIVSRGVDIDAVNSAGETPLLIACKERKTVETARQLLRAGADTNRGFCTRSEHRGWTALHHAAAGWNILETDLILELCAKAARTTRRTAAGETAFDLAQRNSRRGPIVPEEVLEALQGHGDGRKGYQGPGKKSPERTSPGKAARKQPPSPPAAGRLPAASGAAHPRPSPPRGKKTPSPGRGARRGGHGDAAADPACDADAAPSGIADEVEAMLERGGRRRRRDGD
eukprot:TRINITY_DN26098_c0_g2_i2.p1 TRINITY_DN26098_c0_g2~~TRINITY_DN26098_c0_g2_i2.p1  ORF type:complete len:820 (+),score=129.88 TRINITY_DN26098_c0_g2_i2:105-2462(+)